MNHNQEFNNPEAFLDNLNINRTILHTSEEMDSVNFYKRLQNEAKKSLFDSALYVEQRSKVILSKTEELSREPTINEVGSEMIKWFEGLRDNYRKTLILKKRRTVAIKKLESGTNVVYNPNVTREDLGYTPNKVNNKVKDEDELPF